MVIAFVAFLDQKKSQNEEMIDRFSQGDALNQNRAQNDMIIHDEVSLNSAASANQPATGTPNLGSSKSTA